jgi:hypothetical protein
MNPTAFGRYQLIRPLGSGGMADVYLARDEALGREVAVKVPRLSPQALARFDVEARAVARLEHPAIVPLYEYGRQADGRPILVMRHMPGGSLADRIIRGPLRLAEALPIIERIAAALDYAHSRGVIHRDVKPGNILFDDHGLAFLSDFGIARLETTDGGPRLTVAGAAPGSPSYLSPEQARGDRELDGRSDVFSLGVVLYEMLTGGVPFPLGPGQAAAGLPPLPRHLPAGLQPILARALALNPQARYARAADLVADLGRLAGPQPARSSGPGLWAVVVGGLVVAALAWLLLSWNSAPPDAGREATVSPAGTSLSLTSAATGPSTGPTSTAAGAPPSAEAPTTTPTTAPSAAPAGDPFTLGQTARGTNIEAHRFGRGPQKLLFVGGLTGGYAPGTEDTARAAIAHFTAHPEAIPNEVTVLVVPLASPDTALAPGEFSGRLNANGVDINRNWDCEWSPDPVWESEVRPGAGGAAPFSEAESRLLRDFILSESPAAVVVWHARANDGLVSPGGCGPAVLFSAELAEIYGRAAGYRMEVLGEVRTAINGDMTNWLDANGIPALSVLLPSFSATDWPSTLDGITAVIDDYAARPAATPLPPEVVLSLMSDTAVPPGGGTSSPTLPPTCAIDADARWRDTLWAPYQDRLLCALGQAASPDSAYQYFQNGTAIWREDLDRIYILYSDGTFSTHRDDEGPTGYFYSDLLKGGFGYLWRNNAEVRGRLGDPRAAEANAPDFIIQDFQDGVLFYFYERGEHHYALFTGDGTWIEQ